MGHAVEDLQLELLEKIASHLTIKDLARMRAVTPAWKRLTEMTEVLEMAFKNTWTLRTLEGEPQKKNFYLTAGLAHFVVILKLGPKASLASVLVKYKIDSTTLRVVNNCTSDFALQCRQQVYVPVASKESLSGRAGCFHYDQACRRQFVIIKEATGVTTDSENRSSMSSTMDSLAGTEAQARSLDALCSLDEEEMSNQKKAALLKKLSRQMGRGLSIDDSTASYYLQLTNGDMKQAILLFQEDRLWEEGSPVGMLPLRERIPIPNIPGTE